MNGDRDWQTENKLIKSSKSYSTELTEASLHLCFQTLSACGTLDQLDTSNSFSLLLFLLFFTSSFESIIFMGFFLNFFRFVSRLHAQSLSQNPKKSSYSVTYFMDNQSNSLFVTKRSLKQKKLFSQKILYVPSCGVKVQFQTNEQSWMSKCNHLQRFSDLCGFITQSSINFMLTALSNWAVLLNVTSLFIQSSG